MSTSTRNRQLCRSRTLPPPSAPPAPPAGEPIAQVESLPIEGSHGASRAAQVDMTSLTIFYSVLAVMLVGVVVCILNVFGVTVRSNVSCPAFVGYSMCALWQDIRSLASFAFGALVCCILTRGHQEEPVQERPRSPEIPDKVQLYAYML